MNRTEDDQGLQEEEWNKRVEENFRDFEKINSQYKKYRQGPMINYKLSKIPNENTLSKQDLKATSRIAVGVVYCISPLFYF